MKPINKYNINHFIGHFIAFFIILTTIVIIFIFEISDYKPQLKPQNQLQPMYSFDKIHWAYFSNGTNQLNKFGPMKNDYFYVIFK